jgi:regulation of enolase protein 1 (concanavalin A-like superfamily)
MEAITLDPLPFALRWRSPPRDWSHATGVLTVHAGAASDWFVDPAGSAAPVMNAPALLGEVTGDFILSARVEVEFTATFDAGVLVVHADDESWAKLCFERSPESDAMVVSVVTRGASDDCNSTVVAGNAAWLRISRLGAAFAFHASADGTSWSLVRHFPFPAAETLAVGFLAQSPLGDGCRASFDSIGFEPRRLGDLRNGT